jgi:hypothetical protein
MRNQNRVGAIETVFDGYRFRSRLEARWAVFFKTAGIRYIYEPECFRLPSGKLYLPDFYLPEVNMRTTKDEGGIYVEVKPSKPNPDETNYLYELSRITGKSVLLLEGMPAFSGSSFDAEGCGHYEYVWEPPDYELWDCCMVFMRCFKCYRVRVDFASRCEPCQYCLTNTGEESPCYTNHPTLVYAVKVARSYRFDNRPQTVKKFTKW